MSNPSSLRPALLLVEDEVFLAATLREILSDQYEIDVAGNVAEATALLSTRKFDIILSDHMLPGKKQGLDFLLDALEQQPQVKRILMTGYLNPELLSRASTMAELSACLIKPVELSLLRKELAQALGQR